MNERMNFQPSENKKEDVTKQHELDQMTMNLIETKRIVSNPNESNQRMVTMNATDDYNCHVLALCPPLRMNAHTSACTRTGTG